MTDQDKNKEIVDMAISRLWVIHLWCCQPQSRWARVARFIRRCLRR